MTLLIPSRRTRLALVAKEIPIHTHQPVADCGDARNQPHILWHSAVDAQGHHRPGFVGVFAVLEGVILTVFFQAQADGQGQREGVSLKGEHYIMGSIYIYKAPHILANWMLPINYHLYPLLSVQ